MSTMLRKVLVALLTWEARLVLMRHRPRIIAVTGSVGKTTTKDAVHAGLRDALNIRKSEKSFNSEIGVPLSILGLDTPWSNVWRWLSVVVRGALVVFAARYPDWLVLEVGADRPGDISRIATWLRPHIVVFTGVPEIPAHVEFFASPDDVLKEKRSLIEHIRPGGKLVLNADNPRARELLTEYRGMSVTYGSDSDKDYYASHEEILFDNDEPAGLRFRVSHGASSVPISIEGSLGKPRVLGALAAVAVGDCVGIDSISVGRALESWEPTPGRLRLLRGLKYTTILDDTYNSSPEAAFAALDALSQIKTGGRKIAILGDMLELGKYTKDAHGSVGVRAGDVCDMLITVGIRSKAIGAAAQETGLPENRIRQYELGDAEKAAKELLPDLRKGDVVLVKGSQGVRLEKAVRVLMAEPERASELLVRMDQEWHDR